MVISLHDRKVLWGRAHNRCAICKRRLISDGTSTGDRESVLGEEAHIVPRSQSGPRGNESLDCEVDAYENLILLCPEHHRLVDDQPRAYSARYLRQIKNEHEQWGERQFGPLPVKIRPDDAGASIVLRPLATGGEVWQLVAGAHAYRFKALEDEEGSIEQCDRADEFLSLARDWAEISGDVADRGYAEVRRVKRQLQDALSELQRLGLVAYGCRRSLIVEGGIGPPSRWWEAVLAVTVDDYSPETS